MKITKADFNYLEKNLPATKQTKSILEKLQGVVVKKTNKKDFKKTVLEYWNEQNIVVHRSLPIDAERELDRLLAQQYPLQGLLESIKLYATILNGEEYFWNYKWNLYEFLKRGLKKFEGKAPQDYLKSKGGFNQTKREVDKF